MDDDDVRRMLGKAVMKEEKLERDIVGSAVGIVLHRRRRARLYGATASGLAVAMGATALVWATGSSVTAHREQPAASGTTAVSTSVTAASTAAVADPSAWDKDHDIFYRLPGLLDPLLPKGMSLTKSGTVLPNTDFWLNGPTGTNDFNLSAAAKSERNKAMEEGCVVGGVCSHHDVPGGTLYIATKNFTADYGGATGWAVGTAKQVLSFGDEYEFVPSAADGMVVDVILSGTVSFEHYAPHPPSDDYQGSWPPSPPPAGAFDSSGDLLSADAFAALVAKPGFAAVTKLLDRSSPVDKTTLARHKAADAAIAAAVKPVLPPGLTLAIGEDQGLPGGSELSLTGPSGANEFSWTAEPQVKSWHHSQACQSHTEASCTTKDVPGGQIEVTHTSQTAAKQGYPAAYAPGQADTPISGADVYKYLPDDPKGTIISISTGEQIHDIPWAATRPTTGVWAETTTPWPPAARTGEAFDAGGSLLTVDQAAAMVRHPGIADIVRTVTAATDPLDGWSGLQVWH